MRFVRSKTGGLSERGECLRRVGVRVPWVEILPSVLNVEAVGECYRRVEDAGFYGEFRRLLAFLGVEHRLLPVAVHVLEVHPHPSFKQDKPLGVLGGVFTFMEMGGEFLALAAAVDGNLPAVGQLPLPRALASVVVRIGRYQSFNRETNLNGWGNHRLPPSVGVVGPAPI